LQGLEFEQGADPLPPLTTGGDPWSLGWGIEPLKYVGVSEYVWPLQVWYSFIQNCCWITLQVSHHQGWKTCVKHGSDVKLIIRGAYRLSGTGIVKCLEIINVGCNLKQFDGLTWLTPSPKWPILCRVVH